MTDHQLRDLLARVTPEPPGTAVSADRVRALAGLGRRRRVVAVGAVAVAVVAAIAVPVWIRGTSPDGSTTPIHSPEATRGVSPAESTGERSPVAEITHPEGCVSEATSGVKIYLYCINDLGPVSRPGIARLRQVVQAVLDGATSEEKEAGWHGGLGDGATFSLDRRGSVLHIDVDPKSVEDKVIITNAFPIQPQLEASVTGFDPHLTEVRFTVGGQTLCQLNPECVGRP